MGQADGKLSLDLLAGNEEKAASNGIFRRRFPAEQVARADFLGAKEAPVDLAIQAVPAVMDSPELRQSRTSEWAEKRVLVGVDLSGIQ
jgi:hypothetical protein